MKILGRILVREKGIAGLFLPMGKCSIKPGLYNVMEIMDDLTLKYVGKPATRPARLNGISLEELMSERPGSVMTQNELDQIQE
jgi:hypothetical protein